MKSYFIKATLFCLISLSFCPPLLSSGVIRVIKEEKVKVIGVKDGDTIDVLLNQKSVTIRLAHIDCPEKRQPYGTVARQFISTKCFGQMVTIKHEGKYDRNRRLLAEVFNARGDNLNRELVKAGLAWHYKKYSSDYSYGSLEKTARLHKKGLWKDASPVAPWEWRR